MVVSIAWRHFGTEISRIV